MTNSHGKNHESKRQAWKRKIPNLMRDIRPRFTDIPVHLPHDTNVLVAVEQRVLVLAAIRGSAAVGGTVGFQTGIREDHDQSLGVYVVGGDGDMLFRDELGEFRGRTGLGSCVVESHFRCQPPRFDLFLMLNQWSRHGEAQKGGNEETNTRNRRRQEDCDCVLLMKALWGQNARPGKIVMCMNFRTFAQRCESPGMEKSFEGRPLRRRPVTLAQCREPATNGGRSGTYLGAFGSLPLLLLPLSLVGIDGLEMRGSYWLSVLWDEGGIGQRGQLSDRKVEGAISAKALGVKNLGRYL